ncbi:LPXTG cell wall anchor domain-containing protein [Jiangella asiatica]|uniref:LPXTG cell wall anchor domain-containing protein n=1 Tax=Jiangella asiatica TaxID=2530372 RepID=A0A4R5CJD3_9ACTN|nr:LPXTG cell wall anchor domain-containing protein [Jiangella asiatica]TDE00342.1 LPXTG cell wall anchor domain-containing protein [Jiangella asiatica]
MDGLDPAGETVTIRGEGFDLATGIYVVVCVNTGPGQQPTPCLGGADMEGSTGSSVWISSNPPSYGEGLAQPFEEVDGIGSFDVELTVAASDEFASGRTVSADCTITAAPGGSEDGGSEDGGDIDDGSEDGSGSDDGGAGAGGTGDGDLPDTGAGPGPLLAIGLALLAGGVAVPLLDRRRRA